MGSYALHAGQCEFQLGTTGSTYNGCVDVEEHAKEAVAAAAADIDSSPMLPRPASRPCAGARAGTARHLLRGMLAAAALVMIVLGCTLARRSLGGTAHTPLLGDPAASGVGLQAVESATAFAGSLAKSLDTASSLLKDANEVAPQINDIYGNLKNASKQFRGIGKGFDKEVRQRFSAKYKSANETVKKQMRLKLKKMLNITHLHPKENLTDGNPCRGDEEPHGGLCYKKCALLTKGKYTIRTTAWTCCEKEPCGFFNFEHSFKMCGGFDIAGDSMDGECPHPPGGCLRNEQYSSGICYKSCQVLTLGAYPYRMSGQTCCRVDSRLACLFHANINTSLDFAVGGGAGDSDFSVPHPPAKSLTEAQ